MEGRHDPSSPANEEEDVKASDAETAADSEAGEAEADDVEEDETKELLRNGEAAEAPTGAALPARATPPIAAAEILPERKERGAIGEASTSAMAGGLVLLRAGHSQCFVSFILSTTHPGRLFYFYIFQKKIYRNIFWFSKFTVLCSYRPVGGRQGAYRPPARR
jgi:hypothetical protein